jgi:hypothetical protein
MTVSNFTGDGVIDDLIDTNIGFPDSGTSITIVGRVQKVGFAVQPITGSPVSSPGVPGSGTNFWIIQVDYTSGAASVKTSTSGTPTADPNNIVVLSDSIPSTDSPDPMLDGGFTTPDTW